MTLDEAIQRLPKPSWAVIRDGLNINIAFLYYQDSDEIDDPLAEDGPRYELEGRNVAVWGEEFGDHFTSGFGDLSDLKGWGRETEWGKSHISLSEFYVYDNPANCLWELKGVDSSEIDRWPQEVMNLQGDDPKHPRVWL